MPRCAIFGCLFLILFSPVIGAANNVRLQLNGLQGELERNVRARLSVISSDEVSADGRFRARVDEAIRQGLRALGYYDPTITFEFQPAKPPGRPVLLTTVEAGKPVKIAAAHILIEGDARNDKDYQRLLRRSRPAIGTVLNHGAYDDFRNGLGSLALRKGYFDSSLRKSQLGVARGLGEAFWDVDFDSGQRYRFGKITFHGSQIRDDYLQNLVPFDENAYYSSDSLAELNRRLANTGWFNSVVVTPVFDGSQETKRLPLDAEVRPRSRNAIETGVGFSTDVGPRVRTTWRRPWLNDRGQSLETTLNLSAPEQAVDLSYKIPLLRNPLEHYYLLQGGFKRQNLNDTESDSTMLNVARFWSFTNNWQRSVNLRWSLDHFTQASITNTTQLLYPGAMISRTRQRGRTMPRWGDTQRYSVDISNTTWGSDLDFAILQTQQTWIRSLAEQHRFVLRGNVGWIETGDFERVPPSLRFFAGGDRSIRGYKFQGVSPRDSKGQLTGAAKMATGSLEYQYNFRGNWWGATFVDSGEAVNSIRETDLKTGVGFGVRWSSPVGPIKLDLATPVGDQETRNLQFYLGLGPEL